MCVKRAKTKMFKPLKKVKHTNKGDERFTAVQRKWQSNKTREIMQAHVQNKLMFVLIMVCGASNL